MGGNYGTHRGKWGEWLPGWPVPDFMMHRPIGVDFDVDHAIAMPSMQPSKGLDMKQTQRQVERWREGKKEFGRGIAKENNSVVRREQLSLTTRWSDTMVDLEIWRTAELQDKKEWASACISIVSLSDMHSGQAAQFLLLKMTANIMHQE